MHSKIKKKAKSKERDILIKSNQYWNNWWMKQNSGFCYITGTTSMKMMMSFIANINEINRYCVYEKYIHDNIEFSVVIKVKQIG